MNAWLKDILAAVFTAVFVISATIVICAIAGTHP